MRGKHGFTLIELMIVIAIIAILAAILFPVFNNARKKSLETNCISNLRQLTTAIKMYAGDNDDQFPYALYGDLPRSAWGDVIFQGYVNNDQIYDWRQSGTEPVHQGVRGLCRCGLFLRH
jgi:prepilin-type N-terminal cleavage/methylation domain-containing protein